LATGTVSGPSDAARACLLERTRRGADPVRLHNGDTRVFLEDGDLLTITGWCARPGAVTIGWGECGGRVTGGNT
jgi:fumarylacetoacetase